MTQLMTKSQDQETFDDTINLLVCYQSHHELTIYFIEIDNSIKLKRLLRMHNNYASHTYSFALRQTIINFPKNNDNNKISSMVIDKHIHYLILTGM